MATKKKTEKNKKIVKKAELLKVDLGGAVHLEKEDGKYYVIFNVNGKQPFWVQLPLLNKLVENYNLIAQAQGDKPNAK